MSIRNILEYSHVGFIADALALDGEVEEGLGGKIGHVPEFWDDNGTSG